MAESQRQKYEDVSRWSDSTESSSNYYSASSSEEDRSEYEEPEPYQARLARWKLFFDKRPLMRCLDSEEKSVDEQLVQDLMFERLLNEVQVSLSEMSGSEDNYRGEVKVRSFWDDVRARLKDYSDEGLEADWPPTGNLMLDSQMDNQSPKPEVYKPARTAEGKDPVLVEIRKFVKGTLRSRADVAATTDPVTATLKRSATAPAGSCSTNIKRLSSNSTVTTSISPPWIPFLPKASYSISITTSTRANTRKPSISTPPASPLKTSFPLESSHSAHKSS